jgi:hypothetical protein
MRCLTIELREIEVTALVRTGYLKPETRNDLGAVRNALYGFQAVRLALPPLPLKGCYLVASLS